jgi:N-acetylmuramoyl-L-alanine amidase
VLSALILAAVFVAPVAPRDADLLVRTVAAEARGEGPRGRAAVAWVVLNRARDGRWGGTVRAVVLARGQFSCHAAGAPGRWSAGLLPDDVDYVRAARDVARVLSGAVPDPTGGAEWYHALRVRPAWASALERTAEIGRHVFYRRKRA